MVLTKEEIIKKYSEMDIDDDFKMELLEDLDDSINEEVEADPEKEQLKVELSDTNEKLSIMTSKYEEIKEKYIRRFSDPDESKLDEDDEQDEDEEEKIIDVKEI